jgi:hypothetical protein
MIQLSKITGKTGRGKTFFENEALRECRRCVFPRALDTSDLITNDRDRRYGVDHFSKNRKFRGPLRRGRGKK